MTVTSPNEAFETAINSVAMEHHVRSSLGDADDTSAPKLYTSRVFPMNEEELCIQFVAEYIDSHGNSRRALRGACLSLGGNVPERYRGLDGLAITAPAIGLAIPVFPFDPALPQLGTLCQPRAAWERLNQWLGYNGNGSNQISRTIQAYRLERRCVLRFDVRDDDHETRVYVKIARPKKLRRAANAFNALRARGFGADGTNVVPEFGHVDGEGFAFMSEVAGSSVHDLVETESFGAALGSAARILAKLHGSEALAGADLHSPDKEIEKLKTWGRLMSRLYPDLSGEFEDRLEQIASLRPAAIANPVPVHTDFHDKQIICTADQTALIDCDGLANGDPAQDYGNFVAHIELRRMQHADHAEGVTAALQRFREVYPEPAGAEWWAAATFLRLAALYSLRPRWRHLTPELLELAGVDSARKVIEA